jgi:hypothetical protein
VWVADNHTPFAIDRGFLRDREGGEVWIMVVKGTFDVRPDGRLRVADEQTPPAREAKWTGEPGKSSLLHDADFVLSKSGTDVLLLGGHAYPPRGRRVSQVDVALKIGSRTKALRAHGVRAWTKGTSSAGVVPGPSRPVEAIPLKYELAFGGTDAEPPAGKPDFSGHNPVGMGFSHRPNMMLDKAAPQLELLGAAELRAGPYDLPPAGFGAIAPSWSPRAALAGTYDERWQESRAPLLPADFDDHFTRSAPLDQQQPDYLPAGQTIELLNLTTDGYLKIVTPRLALRTRVLFTDGEERAPAVLHTVLIEPDARRVQLVWHSSLRCHRREHKLTRAIVDWEGERECLSP